MANAEPLVNVLVCAGLHSTNTVNSIVNGYVVKDCVRHPTPSGIVRVEAEPVIAGLAVGQYPEALHINTNAACLPGQVQDVIVLNLLVADQDSSLEEWSLL